MSVTAGALPGNLIAQADSDFESALTGSWTLTNCTAAVSAAQSFTGTHSLAVTATTTGNVSIAYTAVTAVPSTGYVMSGYAYATAAGWAAEGGASWFQTGGGLLSQSFGASHGLTSGSWVPFTAGVASVASTATAQVTFLITGMSAAQTVYLDLLYGAPSLVQVLTAWGTPPLSTPAMFADMTPFTRADQSITLTRGRPDETAQVQAGTATWTLDNQVIAGAFSQGNANSPFNIQLSRRTQIRFADETGAFHTRFDGMITDIVPAWAGGPGLEGTVQVTANGLMAWLARNPGPTLSVLRTLVEEEMEADGPLCLYPLSDKAGSTSAADVSGNSAPALIRRYGGTAVTFGSPGSIIGSFAADFDTSPLQSAVFAGGGSQFLSGKLSQTVTASAGFSFEIWWEDANVGVEGVPVAVVNRVTGGQIGVILDGSTPNCVLFVQPTATAAPSSSASFSITTTTGQIVVTVSGTTATAYLNGSSVATVTVPSAFAASDLYVGGYSGNPEFTLTLGPSVFHWQGALNCAAVYPSVLSGSRITAHWTAGSQQNQGQVIDALITNTLNYAGIPSAFYSVPASGGVSYADAYDATGQNPLAMIQLYQQTDWGVFYEASNGKLTWQDRAARYGNQVTPALTLTGGQYEPDFTFPLTTQYLINDATFANNTIPNGVRSVNSASVTNNGTYANGTAAGSQYTNTAAPSTLTSTTAGSPLTGPWYSYPWQPGTTPSPDVLTDAANWQVNIYGTPVPRSPSLDIDLASALGSGTQASRAAVFACDIGSVVQVSGLPPTSPAGTRVDYMMVEGCDETFTRTDSGVTWTLTFNTSPASQSAAWIAGDANLGVLDSTAVVGLGTDGASQPSYGEYVGQPYPVPTFSSTMNRTGSVGANDMRGLTANTTLQIYPPLTTVQQVSLAQSVSTGTNTEVEFDTVWYDQTPDGSGGWTIPANSTTYTVKFPGLYLLTGSVVFATNATGVRQAWFEQNGTVVGQAAEQAAFSTNPAGVFVTAQVQCVQGDTLQLWCSQTSGGALGLVTTGGGPVFSILWLGM